MQSRVLLLASVFLLIFFGVFGIGARAEAEAPTPIAAGTSVRILHEGKPPVNLSPLQKNEQAIDPLTCLAPDKFEDYFQKDKAKFRQYLEPKKQCALGMLKATRLQQEISNLDAARNAVQTLASALSETKQALAGRTTIDGLQLVAIPIGGLVATTTGYQTAKTVEMKCVSNKASKAVVDAEIAVGKSAFVEGPIFDPITPEQVKKITDMKTKAAEVRASYDGLAATYAANEGKGSFFKATWARAVAIATDIGALLTSAKSDFVMLTREAAEKNYPLLSNEQKFTLSFRLTPNKPVAVPSLTKLIQDHGGVPPNAVFKTGVVAIGTTIFSGLPIPEAHSLDGFQKAVDVLQKNFTTGEFFVFDEKTNEFIPDKEKKDKLFDLSEASLKARRDKLQAEFDALETNGFNCSGEATIPKKVAAVDATSSRSEDFVPTLREAPPTEGRAAASATGRRDVSSGSSSEPAYLIIESFNPKNPWGAIFPVVEDEETAEEGTKADITEAVTFSVDGATDAVGVKKGEEAEVKWEGNDTIVSCRGSWAPTEKLPQSGTAKVLVTKSSTFSLSCLDATGKTTTASVAVSVMPTYSVELANPGYLPKHLNQVQKIFAGRKIRLIPSEPTIGIFPSSVRLQYQNEKRDALLWEREVETTKRDMDGSFAVTLPDDTPSGVLHIQFDIRGGNISVPISIESGQARQGIFKIVRKSLFPPVEAPVDKAVASIKRLGCNRCYWESVSAVNPLNRDYGYFLSGTSSGARDFLVQTKDGWRTFVTTHLNDRTDPLLKKYVGDPKMAFTHDGRLTIASIMYFGSEPYTGGVYIEKEAFSFPSFFAQTILAEVPPNLPSNISIIFDYEKIAYDNHPSSPFFKSLYVSTNLAVSGSERVPGLYTVRDGAVSFFTNSNVGLSQGGPQALVVGPDGSVIAGKDAGIAGKLAHYSRDGGKSFTLSVLSGKNKGVMCGSSRVSAESNLGLSEYSGPEFAVDEKRKITYAIWADFESCITDPSFEHRSYSKNFDIFVSSSRDGGQTWSAAVRVNDDRGATDQYFPSIAVDDTDGAVYVAFIDRRNGYENGLFDVYLAKSDDEGHTFSKNIKVNDWGVPLKRGGREPGDYLDMLSVGKDYLFVLHPCVADNAGKSANAPTDACVSRVWKTLAAGSEDAPAPATGGGTGGINLSATKPSISAEPGGEAATELPAGEVTLRVVITNEGAEIRETFGNTIQYRDVTANGVWIPWVTFEVAGLVAGGEATVRHTWGAGAGNWGFRLVADSGGTIAETNEQDNYSEATPVFIVAGTTLPPSPPPSGMPKLFLATPVISGRQAGLGKVYAGSMTISAKATNSGDGILPASSGGFQYSTDGKDW
ncbi:MAG: CARDB domain-containing protein, partial [bacterium]|nr:CARDB domain-containing protein [bacterium]